MIRVLQSLASVSFTLTSVIGGENDAARSPSPGGGGSPALLRGRGGVTHRRGPSGSPHPAYLARARQATLPLQGRAGGCGAFSTQSIARFVLVGFATALLLAPAAEAADSIVAGSVDAASASLWPLYIAEKNGYFDAVEVKPEIIFSQSNASVIQQLTAGSLNIAPSAGLVDPVRAIDKGASLAIVRILIQAPPYALLAKPAIKRTADLKGKTIIIGGPKDITRIFTERMLTANGLKPGDYDFVFAGATSARFSALQSGAVDAAILTVPFNFYAETAGFTNLGFTFDVLPDVPFAGMAVNRGWAAANPKVVERFLIAVGKGIAWFDDPSHREEAVSLMVSRSRTKPEDVERSYDFLRMHNLFEPTGKVSRKKIGAVVEALQQLGDVPAGFSLDRLFLPGVTQLTD